MFERTFQTLSGMAGPPVYNDEGFESNGSQPGLGKIE